MMAPYTILQWDSEQEAENICFEKLQSKTVDKNLERNAEMAVVSQQQVILYYPWNKLQTNFKLRYTMNENYLGY